MLLLFFIIELLLPTNNMNCSDPNILYSPRHWSKVFNSSVIFDEFQKLTVNATASVKKNVAHITELPYGNADNVKLDIYGTDLPDGSPIFIFVHGGGWLKLGRTTSGFIAGPLHRKNFKVIVLGYDVSPAVTIPEIVDEIRTAFLFCINYAKTIKSRGLYIGGHSAGSHLVANLFTTFFSTLPKSDRKLLKEVYLLSGLYDLTPLVGLKRGKVLDLSIDVAESVSPLIQNIKVDKHVKFHLYVGADESPAYINQTIN